MHLDQMNALSMQAYRSARKLERAVNLLLAHRDVPGLGEVIAIVSRAAGTADALAEQLDMPGACANGLNVVRFNRE
jgi:hypothetical protein